MVKRLLVLVIWVAVMLAPIELFMSNRAEVSRIVSLLIGSEFAHVIGHLVLFSGLAFLLLYLFRLKLTTRSALLLALISIAVGMGQEYLQLQFKLRAFGFPEVFDLGVDLLGATLGWLGYAYFQRYERYLRIAYYILQDVR